MHYFLKRYLMLELASNMDVVGVKGQQFTASSSNVHREFHFQYQWVFVQVIIIVIRLVCYYDT